MTWFIGVRIKVSFIAPFFDVTNLFSILRCLRWLALWCCDWCRHIFESTSSSTMVFLNSISRALVLLLLTASSVSAFVPAAPSFRTAHSLSAITVDAPDAEAPEPEGVEFPPPLSSVEQLKRAATFWSTAVPIIANYYGKFAEMKLREGLLGEKMSDEEVEVCLKEGACMYAEVASSSSLTR
jgi:hypothetical protein